MAMVYQQNADTKAKSAPRGKDPALKHSVFRAILVYNHLAWFYLLLAVSAWVCSPIAQHKAPQGHFECGEPTHRYSTGQVQLDRPGRDFVFVASRPE
jgi:hypothetical protein